MNCNVDLNAAEKKVIHNGKMQTSRLTPSGHLCTGGLSAPGSSPSHLPAPVSITCTATNQYGSAEYTTLLNSSGGLP